MWRSTTWFAVGLLSFLIGAELLFRALPVSTSTETDYYLDAAVLTYPPYHQWQVATGWDLRNAQVLRSNNAGFATQRDFVVDPHAVALIGDSYVEASMLDVRGRPGAQLERLLTDRRPVFAMGAPGSSLLDYAERIRLARERFGVRDFVVLMEAGDVRQAICGSGNVHSACLEPGSLVPRVVTLKPPSRLKRALRDSAFAQYLVSQLKVEPGQMLRQVFVRSTPGLIPLTPTAGTRGPYDAALVAAVAAEFFSRVAPHVQHGRLVIVVDGPRSARSPPSSQATLERNLFMQLASAAGAKVVDLEPFFAMHSARSSLSLEVGPYDRHLNELGVAIAMRAAADVLR